jgi:hypothetical protein
MTLGTRALDNPVDFSQKKNNLTSTGNAKPTKNGFLSNLNLNRYLKSAINENPSRAKKINLKRPIGKNALWDEVTKNLDLMHLDVQELTGDDLLAVERKWGVGFMRSLVGLVGKVGGDGSEDYGESLTVDRSVADGYGSWVSVGKKD